VKTFKGCRKFLVKAKPLWALLENVDIGDDITESANLAIILRALKDAGYATRLVLSCASVD
jgi:hypothetical protein